MLMIAETVTKGEFAEMIGVTPGRISQMIKAGQISPESLSGEGRGAKVIIDRAKSDLRRSLDPSQSLGLNGMATRAAISDKPAEPTPVAAVEPVSTGRADIPAPVVPFDNTADLIGREKLRQAAMVSRRMERDEALEEGRYVLSEEARAAIGAAASKTLSTFESGLADMADAVAAKHNIPPRDVLHTLTQSFRDIREAASKVFADQRDAIKVAEAEALARAEQEDSESEDE